jgi:hypothetical protein
VDICSVATSGEAIAGTERLARADGSPECSIAFAVPGPNAKVAVSAIVTKAVMIPRLTAGVLNAAAGVFAAISLSQRIFESITIAAANLSLLNCRA